MTFPHPHLIRWLAAVKQGNLAAAPAEGQYGYVADPFNPQALQNILNAKQRKADKGFIVLISSWSHLDLLCPPLPPAIKTTLREVWPCPPEKAVTVLLPAKPGLPPLLTGGGDTIAVRFPATSYMQAYLEGWAAISPGPLVSTSLNLSGQPPATSAEDIPTGVTTLALPQPLTGPASRIWDLKNNSWLR